MNRVPPAPSFLVIAGEVSGDMRAAGLVAAIRHRRPDAAFFGIGGPALRDAGMEILRPMDDMAVMGFSEVLRRLGFFRRVFREMVEVAARRRPTAAILVDYPGFNLRLAGRLRRLGITVIYYICPQVWAWRRSRIPRMARDVDLLLTLFPFEAACFQGTGLDARFVGHPLVDDARLARVRPRMDLPWSGRPRVALLPGSREQEIGRILPVMWDAATVLRRSVPGVGFVIPTPSERTEALTRRVLAGLPGDATGDAPVVLGAADQALLQADAAMVASGTATIEAALLGCPMVVVYRTAALTYWLLRMLIRVPHIGMVNLIAGRELCREFVQGGARPEAIAEALVPLLRAGAERDGMVAGLADVGRALGAEGSHERAAVAVLDALDRAGRTGGSDGEDGSR